MAELRLSIIEQIKLLRSVAGLGLVESKVAVEEFDKAQGLIDHCITSMTELLHFTKYCGLFANEKIVVDTSSHSIYPTSALPLTSQEIYAMIKQY